MVGALVAALAFLSAPITAAILDHAVVGRMWFAEVVCALEFLLVCLAALRSTRRRSDHIGTNGLDRGSDSGTNHTHHAKT